jgi:hypothetical protein
MDRSKNWVQGLVQTQFKLVQPRRGRPKECDREKLIEMAVM